jgi:hypothetical protein
VLEEQVRDLLACGDRPPTDVLDRPAVRCTETEHLLPKVFDVDRDRQFGAVFRAQITTVAREARGVTLEVDPRINRRSTPTHHDARQQREKRADSPPAVVHHLYRASSIAALSEAVIGRSRNA